MRSRPLFDPLPDWEYSIIPLEPETNRGGLAAMISGNRSQFVEPGVSHWQPEALVVVHCAKADNSANTAKKSMEISFFIRTTGVCLLKMCEW